MWFNILKLDLSQLNTQIQSDADAKAINIQKPNKCKEKLLKIIEIMKDADRKAREALPNALEEVLKDSEYKNKKGETIKFKVGDWIDEKRIFAENAPYRFGFAVRSDMRNSDRFKEIDEMVACQLLEALEEALREFNVEVSEVRQKWFKRSKHDNSKDREVGRVEYQFLTRGNSFVRNRLAIYDTSNYFNEASISYGASGHPYSHETFEDHAEFEKHLVNKLFTDVYSHAFKKIKGML